MGKDKNLIIQDGVVTQALPNAMFRVELGKNFIKIIEGDSVKIEISPYDLSRGRIVTRY